MATLKGRAMGDAAGFPVPLPLDQLNRITDFRFVLVTSGLEHQQQAIFERTRGSGTVTISTDLACVEAGWCVIGVNAEPRVQVLVNGKAAVAAGVQFDATFLMMIREQ